ncbi:MAG: hypothetical protein HQL20_10960 [Candidatus Omnitrophica bacterium]|nr:hypothetical protein [Candidatus Omnitrophota bacterium]
MSDRIWSAVISLSLWALAAMLGLGLFRPLNGLEMGIALLPVLALGALCIARPILSMRMSEGPRWSLGLKLDLNAKPPSRLAIILIRIFGVLAIFFYVISVSRFIWNKN